jgi:CRISPR/Cas system-associated exonuclease Cas4 (RecB family)
MQLPDNSVGISDVLQYRLCPERFAFDMQRWSAEGEAPEAENPNNAYGSAIHLAIATSEEGSSDEQAIQAAVDRYGRWLDLDDLDLLAEDLDNYHDRDYAGVRTVASEENVKVPLFEWNGEIIYYRFTLDRLYQRIASPEFFVHLDYKSSKWRKSEEEVHKDLQLWAYNWAIFEHWPEVEQLTQIYDQLRFGRVQTRKNAHQREEIKRWLVKQITSILQADEVKPKFNEWCPWCPIMESCPAPKRTSEFARARIEALSPSGDVAGILATEPDRIAEFVEELEEIETARKCLQRFEESVKDVLKQLPTEKRRALGFTLYPSSKDTWRPEALRAVHAQVGDDFYLLVKMTKSNISRFYGKDKAAAEKVLQFAEKESANPRMSRIRA